LIKTLGYSPVAGVDFWTSGSDAGVDGNYFWCSEMKEFKLNEVNWKSGQPNSADGDCVTVKFSNTSANMSTYSVGNCADEKLFVCEVSTS